MVVFLERGLRESFLLFLAHLIEFVLFLFNFHFSKIFVYLLRKILLRLGVSYSRNKRRTHKILKKLFSDSY